MIAALPHITAALNALAGLLLVIGYGFIRAGRRVAHHNVMTAAVIVSVLFLISYVIHHAFSLLHPFPGTGIIKPVYYVLLISHVGLAILVTPMVALTYMRARRGAFERHKALARWTFPIWLYVSVTGILVYILLYQVYATEGT